MYCIRRYGDRLAIFNRESEEMRTLTEDEVLAVRRCIPEVNENAFREYYAEEIDCVEDKP
jgi:hypothetical protein